jgi:CheY-like chemotaxis protein
MIHPPHSTDAANGRLNDGREMSKNSKNTYELFEDWQLAQTSSSVPDGAFVPEVSVDYPDVNLSGGTETILFIDDEEIIIDVARDMLEILGYKVFVAQNGEDAVRIYEQQKDVIDLVIQDMVMPGMNGAAVFKAIKKINPAVRVILASGYVMNKQIAAVMEDGCRAFMQKPFRLEELSTKVREVLDAP